tara:strand:- start:147 stop:308 length:162 start_codon:yes stop_codon:yes gene_type:complete
MRKDFLLQKEATVTYLPISFFVTIGFNTFATLVLIHFQATLFFQIAHFIGLIV